MIFRLLLTGADPEPAFTSPTLHIQWLEPGEGNAHLSTNGFDTRYMRQGRPVTAQEIESDLRPGEYAVVVELAKHYFEE